MYNIIISCFSLHRIALLRNTDAVSVLRENGFLEVYAIKKLIKKLCSGISVGCVAFVAIIFIFPLFEGGCKCFLQAKNRGRLAAARRLLHNNSDGFFRPHPDLRKQPAFLSAKDSDTSNRRRTHLPYYGAFLGVDKDKARRRSPVSPYLIGHRRFPRAPCLSFRQTAGEVNKNNDPNPFP